MLVAQSCPTLCNPGDCSRQAPLSMGILQARVLERVAMPSSRGIFATRGLNPGFLHCRQILFFFYVGRFFTSWATRGHELRSLPWAELCLPARVRALKPDSQCDGVWKRSHLELTGSVVKNPPVNVGDLGLVPESGRSPGEGNGNPLQCSCLGNPMDRGAWRAAVRVVAKSQTWFTD